MSKIKIHKNLLSGSEMSQKACLKSQTIVLPNSTTWGVKNFHPRCEENLTDMCYLNYILSLSTFLI